MKHARQREAAVGRMEAGCLGEAGEPAAVVAAAVVVAASEPGAGSGWWW